MLKNSVEPAKNIFTDVGFKAEKSLKKIGPG
jgi:hypothetical protein